MKWLDYATKIPKGVLMPPKPPFEDGNNDVVLTVPEIIKKYDYPLEVYSNVVTEDKYLLDIFRIPHGRRNFDPEKKRPPVLLVHGLISSAADFVVMGPNRGLAFLLADMGYDVWLGNARGSTFSCKHVELDPKKDKRYWRFSWHEIGVYDLPAMFDLVLNVTGHDKLSYIGISQGTTVFFVCLSEKPEYNKRVSIMIALAPIAYMEHFHSPLPKRLASLQRYIGDYIPKDFAFPPPFFRQTFQIYNRMYCQNEGLYQNTGAALLFSLIGDDHEQLNEDDVAKILSKLPDKSSGRQFFHFGQCIGTSNFRKFDYGHKKNLRIYDSIEPPPYALRNVTAPVALFHGKGDWFSRPLDVFRLSQELGNCIVSHKVRYYTFNHYDYISARDVHKLLYDYVFKLLNEYN